MYRAQKGFTLIELIVVIVLLGILGVTALGKFQDLSSDAQTAANSGVASELSSAAAINYAASLIGTADVTIDTASAACTTALLGGLFQTGAPTGYTITDPGTAACAASGDTYNCDIDDTDTIGTTATATIICTGG